MLIVNAAISLALRFIAFRCIAFRDSLSFLFRPPREVLENLAAGAHHQQDALQKTPFVLPGGARHDVTAEARVRIGGHSRRAAQPRGVVRPAVRIRVGEPILQNTSRERVKLPTAKC